MNNKLNILILSSISPYKSANLGLDVINSLEQAGHSVDFVTKYQFDGMSSNMSAVYDISEKEADNEISVLAKFKFFLKKAPYLFALYKFLRPSSNKKEYIAGYAEDMPPVKSELILEKIKDENYDLIITLHWHYFITTKTLKDLYTKLKCPIFIYAADFYPMTGGCFNFGDCRNFLKSCGMCPHIGSNNKEDRTYKNFQFKKEVYENIGYYFLSNTWVCNFASQSSLFQKERIKKKLILVNDTIFSHKEVEEARLILNLSSQKFIMFAGAFDLSNYRKGFDILVNTINKFVFEMEASEKDNILLLLAGNPIANIQSYFDIEVLQLGFVDINTLANIYSSANCFLSSSTQDAGPSMVNQSLMCGTPVVAFEIGVALDVVINGQTGYRAKYKDIQDFTNGIRAIYSQTEEEYNHMRKNCRDISLKESSLSAFSSDIEKYYFEHILNSFI